MATFAAMLFRQAYQITHPEPTISEYLANAFAIPRWARTLEDPASTILLASADDLSSVWEMPWLIDCDGSDEPTTGGVASP